MGNARLYEIMKEKNNDINQSKMEYWKEAEEKNQRYKKIINIEFFIYD